MDREHFQRVKELFRSSLGVSEELRPEFLERSCGSDARLREEVEELLRHAATSRPGFLEEPAETPRESTPPSSLEIPGFELHERIAVGASSIVFRATQLSPRREVAIKVLRVDTLGHGGLQRFEREAETLGALQHPGVAQIYGAGVAETWPDPTPWIAMELVRGATLDAFVASVRPSTTALVRLFVELCEALRHVHQRGIVHRDLKSSNVMVDETGRIRVLDFGVARLIGERRSSAAPTRSGALIGTLAYMAPEQARGEHDKIDARSDVYALGVMLFELLCDRLPLEVDHLDLLDALRAVCESEPARLRDGRPDLSPDLDAIVGKCLEKPRERRYANAGDLADDLARMLERRPVQARRPTLIYQTRKFIARNRRLTTVALGMLLVLLVGLAAALQGWRAERRQLAQTSETLGFFADRVISLAPQLGFGDDQRSLLEEIETRIRSHLAVDPQNRRLLAALAQTLDELACMDQDRGAYESQYEHAYAAYEIRRRLLEKAPNDLASWVHLSRLCAKIGEALRDRGSVEGRDEWFARGLEIDRRLVRENPGNLELLEDLGWTLTRVARVAHDRGDLEFAHRLEQERLDDAQRIVGLEPRNWKYLYNLSQAHYFRATCRREESDFEGALSHSSESVRRAREAVDVAPRRRDLIAWLAQTCTSQARDLRKLGRPAAAWELTDEALALMEQVTLADPFRPEHARHLTWLAKELLPLASGLERPGATERVGDSLERVARHIDRAGQRELAREMTKLAQDLRNP